MSIAYNQLFIGEESFVAIQQEDEDLDLGAEHVGFSRKKLIIITVGVVLLLAIGLGVGWLLMDGEEATAQDAPEELVVEEQLPAIYLPLNPVFVVNLPPGGKARMLQVGVQVMVRDPALVEFLKHNDPMVRHNLLSLFGNQQDAVLRDRKGKEKLQAEVIKMINQILKEHNGGEIEAVYFTSFVMQ